MLSGELDSFGFYFLAARAEQKSECFHLYDFYQHRGCETQKKFGTFYSGLSRRQKIFNNFITLTPKLKFLCKNKTILNAIQLSALRHQQNQII